jgi:adenylate kinase family enzyme
MEMKEKKTMLKIHIIGGSGSGKTTLGGQLAERFGIPHYDLDQIGWKHGMEPLARYVEEALTILKQPGWVTEGNYLFWTDPLLHQADCIVLLDIPLTVAVWRVLYRHVDKSLRGTNPYATKLMIPLLKGIFHFYDHTDRPPTEFMRNYLELYRQQTKVPVTSFNEEFSACYLAI